MAFFSLIAVMITSGTAIIYGKAIWDPTQLAAKFSNPFVVTLGIVTLLVATVSVNVAANVVSPSYDFSNLAPRLISRRVGGLIAGVIGVVIMPWRLLSNPHVYIYDWLNFYGGVLGAVAGVLIAGYWILKRTRLDLADLYRKGGAYWYAGGWSWQAVVATVVGAVLAVGGASTPAGTAGPFPAAGLIPFLKPLYSYSWAVGFGTGLVLYLLLAAPGRAAASTPAEPVAVAAGE
jgi:NCS1 family nucleobase:cation symporter-1